MKYFLANIILSVMPVTRGFRVKRHLLRALGILIGPHTKICGRVKFFGGGKVLIGRDCWIGIGTSFFTSVGANVALGDRCDVAPEVSFTCGSHATGDHTRRAGPGMSRSICVGGGTWICTRAIVLGGVDIGDACIVGAGSLVLSGTYQRDSLIVGSPGRSVRSLPVGAAV